MSPAAEGSPASVRPRGAVVLGWVLLAAAVLAGLPALADWPGVGLDPSWKLALHLCRERGLVVGRDTLYTYGPWGFLAAPLVLVRSQWLAAVAWLLGCHLALATAVAVWMRRGVTPRLAWLAPLPLLLVPLDPEYELPLAVVLAAALAADLGAAGPLAAALVGVAAAVPLLVKTAPGLVAAAAVMGAAVAATALRRAAVAAGFAGGWVAGAMLLGSAALGSPAALLGYLRDAVQIAVAYGPALERGGPSWQPLLVVGGVGALALACAAAGAPAARALPLLVPAAGVWVLAFRHGFNRQQTHFGIAFAVSAALAGWVALALAETGPVWTRRLRAVSAAALLTAAVVVVPGGGRPRPLHALRERVGEARSALHRLEDPAAREATRRQLRSELRLEPGVLGELEGRTVDVLTSEVAVVEAYDLSWRPRPVLQSFVACTADLDRRDAAFLTSEQAPERLLVELFGLDTREPLWDTPLTWRAVAVGWEPVVRDRRWLVLKRRRAPRPVATQRLAKMVVEVNRPFHLPPPARGHLELSLDLELTPLGRLVGLVWKVPEVRLEVVAPATHPARRIVAATAVNPFPVVEPPVATPAELELLLSAPSAGSPRIARLVSSGGWAWGPVVVEAWQVEWLDPEPLLLREAVARPRL